MIRVVLIASVRACREATFKDYVSRVRTARESAGRGMAPAVSTCPGRGFVSLNTVDAEPRRLRMTCTRKTNLLKEASAEDACPTSTHREESPLVEAQAMGAGWITTWSQAPREAGASTVRD